MRASAARRIAERIELVASDPSVCRCHNRAAGFPRRLAWLELLFACRSCHADRPCRSPILSICAPTPPIRCRPGRSGSRSWSQLCRAEAMPAVAITDTGNLFGALEFATACADAGMQPIIGCRDRARARRAGGERSRARATAAPCRAGPDRAAGAERGRLPQSDARWSAAPISTARPAAEPAIGARRPRAASEGLICLAGGAGGPIGRLLAEGQAEAAEAVLRALEGGISRPALHRAEAARHGRGGAQRSRA